MDLGQEETQIAEPLICIVGPTASGKTALALALARRLGAEIISADMGALYRGLDAGTAKPEGGLDEGAWVSEGVRHHLIDTLDLQETSDAASFAKAARAAMAGIEARGCRAVLAGGTGFYVRALVEGLGTALPEADLELRARLAAEIKKGGREKLYAKLLAADPEAKERVPAGNTHRLIRALEVLELTGRPMSEFMTSGAPPLPARYFGVDWPREALHKRISLRSAEMFPRMILEVKKLLAAGCTGEEPGFRCFGYPEALACAKGELDAEEGLERMKLATRKYAKRQLTWFRNQVETVWLKPDEPDRMVDALLKSRTLS